MTKYTLTGETNYEGDKCPRCGSHDTAMGDTVDSVTEDQPDYLVCLNCDTRFDEDVGILNEAKATESSVNCPKCQTRVWDKNTGLMNGTYEKDGKTICGNCGADVWASMSEARAKESEDTLFGTGIDEKDTFDALVKDREETDKAEEEVTDPEDIAILDRLLENEEEEQAKGDDEEEDIALIAQLLAPAEESKKKAIENNIWQLDGVDLNCPVCGMDFRSGRDMGDHLIVEHAWEDSDFEQFEEGRVNEAGVSPNTLLRDTDPLALPTGKNALDQTYGTSEPETPDGQDLTGKSLRRKSTYQSITKMLTENVFDYNEDEIFDNILGGYALKDEKDAVFDSYYKDIEDQKHREEAERRARDKEYEDQKKKEEDDYRRERNPPSGNYQYDWGRHNRELHQYGYGKGY